jgi:hypothetical protein
MVGVRNDTMKNNMRDSGYILQQSTRRPIGRLVIYVGHTWNTPVKNGNRLHSPPNLPAQFISHQPESKLNLITVYFKISAAYIFNLHQSRRCILLVFSPQPGQRFSATCLWQVAHQYCSGKALSHAPQSVSKSFLPQQHPCWSIISAPVDNSCVRSQDDFSPITSRMEVERVMGRMSLTYT